MEASSSEIDIETEIAKEAATYCEDAAYALRVSFNPNRNTSVDWESLAKRRLRAALALLGG